jgi:hypothetical protein
MSNAPHPSDCQLAALKVGKLVPPESVEVERHLAACDTCCEAMNTLPDDSLVRLLQASERAGGGEAGVAPANLPDAHAEATLGVQPGAADGDLKLPPELAGHARYHVLELLGRGGMGTVYKAEHRLMERHVALKVINPSLMKRPAMVERFPREVKAAARFSHPNIVTAYDADQAGAVHFLIMEFVEGISLAQHVEQHGPLPIGQACDYIRQAALGLQFAAEHGMVHRDIKPHNLMLTPGGQVKILDFGLARLVREEAATDTAASAVLSPPLTPHSSPLTEVGTLMGTADFIAPEQANDPRQADSRADIYSLGCTFYHLLAGHAPFPKGSAVEKLAAHAERTPEPLAKLRSDVPSGLTRIIDRMTAKDPAQRYQSPGEVAEAMKPFTAAGAARRRRLRQVLIGAGCLAATLLLAAVIYIQTDKGELIIEADSDKVAVMVNEGIVKVRDDAANREYQLKIGRHSLRPGEYTLDVKELPAGVEFTSPNPVILKRGAKTVVRVTFNAKVAPGYLKDEALRWFPADATFFAVYNLEAFPALAQLHHLLFREELLTRTGPGPRGERLRKFVDLIGRVDRMSLADVVTPERPERSRTFIRFTGKIGHNRLVDFFAREWPGVRIEKRQANGEPITLVYDPQAANPPLAVVLIGSTDLIWAGLWGKGKDLEVAEECLRLRAGHGVSLPVAQAKTLAEIPDNAWAFMAGETPPTLKKNLMIPALLVQPRWFVASVSGSPDIEVRFRGDFASATDATRSMTILNLMKQGFANAPAVLKRPEVAGAVAKALESLQIESQATRMSFRARVPSDAFAALVEKMQDMPLRDYSEAFRPGEKK